MLLYVFTCHAVGILVRNWYARPVTNIHWSLIFHWNRKNWIYWSISYNPCSMFECRILRGNFIWIQIWIGYFLFYHQTTNNKLDRSKPATGNRIIIVQIKYITWRNFWLEHVHGDNVDEHDPARLLQDVRLILHKSHGGDALGKYLDYWKIFQLKNSMKIFYTSLYAPYLTFKFSSVRVGSFEFPSNVLLKFFHVKQFDRFVQLEGSCGKFDNLVRNRILAVRNLDKNIRLRDPLDENVAAVVHLYLAALHQQ